MDVFTVLDRVRGIALDDPERPALRADGVTIDYGTLVAAATRLSERLRAQGVGPEDVVATVLPRGGNAIVAVLGIWMAGAAYLPTDARWPERRRDLVLSESATHVLTESSGSDAEVFAPGEPALRLTPSQRGGTRADTATPGARNLAYILYTSGSTGTPNAVGVEYGAIDNYGLYLHDLVNRSTAARADGRMSALLSANLCFDASFRPILLLSSGVTLVLAPDLADGSWQEQIDCIHDNEVTILSGVPSWYAGLLGAGFAPGASTVRLSFIGGEPVPNGVIRELTSGGGTAEVQYGPTETTVAATGSTLTRDDFTEPPIGQVIPGARAYLYRGEKLATVIEGEPGQMYVGGAGVARGYLNNPRLTAERFVPNPLGPPGSRMFRTGDRARMLPRDGYSFLGREDDQVKISGRRIELGEIVSVLNRHSAVAQSVAFVHRGGAHPRLVACYVGRSEVSGPDVAESLRAHLAGELPEYLVPTVLRRMDSFPTTRHGKVDVAALTELVDSAAAEEPMDDVLDEVEQRLSAIVQKTLGAPCALDDNFFELGGGSLDALDVLAQVREEFGVRVRLRDFFRTGTIRALRNLIGEAG